MTSIQKQMTHVYAIIRLEESDYPHPLAGVTVKKIVWTPERAEAEAARLNALNEEKGVRYFVQLTRLEPKEFGV